MSRGWRPGLNRLCRTPVTDAPYPEPRMQDRRHFLKTAALGLAALPPLIREALAIPAATRTGTIRDVEHVVILMQENRSFDHYFGTLRGVRGFSDPRPTTLPSGRSVFHQPS